MKTNHLILLIAAIMLIFSGCSSNTDGKQNSILGSIGSGSSQTTGNGKGVDLTFAEGQPGAQYNKGQQFNFGFIFKNNQNEDITDMQVKISGIEWGYITGLEKEYTLSSIQQATAQSGNDRSRSRIV